MHWKWINEYTFKAVYSTSLLCIHLNAVCLICIGNDAIHDLTKSGKAKLRIDLRKFTGEQGNVTYSTFKVGGFYRLTLFTLCFTPWHFFCSVIFDIQKVSPCSYLKDANTVVFLQCSNFTMSIIVCWCISLWCNILGW